MSLFITKKASLEEADSNSKQTSSPGLDEFRRRLSLDLSLNNPTKVENKMSFFRRDIFPKAYKRLSETTR